MINLAKILLQLNYDCNPKDSENLESLQKQIQKRISFLNENEIDSYDDPTLLEYYEIHKQIQQCLFDDHTDQYLLIIGMIVGFSLIIYFRWKMIKKFKSAKKRLNFKG